MADTTGDRSKSEFEAFQDLGLSTATRHILLDPFSATAEMV